MGRGEGGFGCGSVYTSSHGFFFVVAFGFRDTPRSFVVFTAVGGDVEVAAIKECEEEGDDPAEPGDV